MLDAHLHVVDPTRVVADSTGNPAGAWWERVDARPATVAARMTAAGVDGGVLVQAVGAHGLDDVSVALEAAATLGFVAMATVDPAGPDPLGALERAVAGGATGLRLFSVPTPEPAWIDSDVAVALVERCAPLGVTPSICCLPAELPRVDRLLATAGGGEVAIDHAGFVPVGGDDAPLVELARHDRLVVKLSTGVFDHAPVPPSTTVDRLVDLVGAERLAWGSDHPQVHDRSYEEIVTLARTATDHLPDTQRAAILEGTTARCWGRRPGRVSRSSPRS